jgi:hypothetical protein
VDLAKDQAGNACTRMESNLRPRKRCVKFPSWPKSDIVERLRRSRLNQTILKLFRLLGCFWQESLCFEINVRLRSLGHAEMLPTPLTITLPGLIN